MNFLVVPDTNIILSAFQPTETSPNKELLDRWERGEFQFLYNFDTIDEYLAKLRSRQTPIEDIQLFLQTLLRLGHFTPIRFYLIEKYPSDPEDTPFLLCALNGNATHLISYDKDLLDLDRTYPVKICEPIPFLQELRQS